MPFRHSRAARSLTALILALCFGLFTAESLLADVHDDDATHEELVRFDGAQRHAVAHAAHGDVPQSVSGEHAPAVGVDDHPGERPPGQSEHDEHACHHAHAHVGPLSVDAPSLDLSASFAGSVLSRNDRAPVSRAADPQFRPPIA